MESGPLSGGLREVDECWEGGGVLEISPENCVEFVTQKNNRYTIISPKIYKNYVYYNKLTIFSLHGLKILKVLNITNYDIL